MKNLKIELNSEPFSINQAYYKRSFTRTKECRAWGAAIHDQIATSKIKEQITEFLQGLPRKLALRVSLRFLYPADKLYTKKGEISRKSMDLSNIEKMLIDLLFDKRYDGRQSHSGEIIRTLALDDKVITELRSSKALSPTDSHTILVEIEQINMP